ncbi:unnamed protein product [Musa acuminata subsp. malaccensis]|uniref:(wild Malaysian banana) hypothetical protein n=1 Tax=Musa acuminata subsp. malaccensis TaxID=214687 RepID=A0A8D7AZH6_MUSAM|nr:unnamed protein product [Musa acuminata subsp. malaccensis]
MEFRRKKLQIVVRSPDLGLPARCITLAPDLTLRGLKLAFLPGILLRQPLAFESLYFDLAEGRSRTPPPLPTPVSLPDHPPFSPFASASAAAAAMAGLPAPSPATATSTCMPPRSPTRWTPMRPGCPSGQHVRSPASPSPHPLSSTVSAICSTRRRSSRP